MAQAAANKLYRTFVKGLVTEASPLTYPEDTSYAELNTVLSRKGSRTRRLGINYNSDTLVEDFAVDAAYNTQVEYVWRAVAQESNLNFFVVQKDMNIKFFDMSDDSEKSFSIDMLDYIIPDVATAVAKEEIFQMAGGKGFLFIVSRYTTPIAVEYNPEADTINIIKLEILIRDFDGLADGLANDEEPSTLSKEHHYNLLNQGWLYGKTNSQQFSEVSYGDYVFSPRVNYYEPRDGSTGITYYSSAPSEGPIQKFYNTVGRYPGNNKQWWVARAEADNPDENVKAGDFLPQLLDSLYSGNNRAPRGHFILKAFNKDRGAVSGISGIEPEVSNYRPEAVTFFSGRVWYAAGSTVYYSQIIDSTGIYRAANCYQEADPSAEDISDLIASDGGVVPLLEADRIRQIIPVANGVAVIAQNGVWFIGGGDGGFSATSLSSSKVSSIGSKSPLATVQVDDTIFWWSETGIQAMAQASGQFGPIPGKFGNTSITEQTIQTLFNEINPQSKIYAKGCYDPKNNQILWLYNNRYNGAFYYDSVLIYDLTLQSFTPWRFSYEEGYPRITGIYYDIGESFTVQNNDVLDSNGDAVIVTDLTPVVSAYSQSTYELSSVKYLVEVPDEGMVTASVEDSGLVDWASFDGNGLTYSSYVETGYELMNDSMRKKAALYVFCHFKQAENSSCEFTTKWDWANSRDSNKWSTTIEAYRERIRPSNSTANLEGFEVVTSKNKVRGNGKSVQFRFECSERGKNFELLGWSVAYVGNTQP